MHLPSRLTKKQGKYEGCQYHMETTAQNQENTRSGWSKFCRRVLLTKLPQPNRVKINEQIWDVKVSPLATYYSVFLQN
jgi:hypothetical protein